MSLTVENVSKIYDKTPALEGVNFKLEYGIYGLLGPNGAGKTTLMRIIADLLVPSTGRVLFNGQEISSLGPAFREKLGYLPQDFGVYPNFTAEQFLLYIARLKGLSKFEARRRTDELLELVGLSDIKRERLGGFSGGQRQRVGIAQALLNDPQILIMDEPTAGLDPEERIRFRRILSDLSQNKTVLLSTHIVSDIEAVANEVILLKKGRVLEIGKPAELLVLLEGKVWTVTLSIDEGTVLAKQYPCSNTVHFEGKSTLRLISEQQPHPAAQPITPNMEDMYLYFFR